MRIGMGAIRGRREGKLSVRRMRRREIVKGRMRRLPG
jgi:hypothetical protein